MRVRLQREIERLNRRVISLGALVEERFRMAVKAIECRDPGLAHKVVEGDLQVDKREVDLEEECLKILALHQPVADQLRYIIAVLKLNSDLERIGDLAVNIAERAEAVTKLEPILNPFDYSVMVERTGTMLSNSLDALVNRDLHLAFEVCAADDDVDAIKTAVQIQLAQEIRKNPSHVESLLSFYLVSRHLERIADHATNIAEDVIYMITGDIHRHRGPASTSD
jgi:phosphate transport system protein